MNIIFFPCGAVYYCVFVVSTFVDYDANNEDLTDDDDEHPGRRCKKNFVIGSITAAIFSLVVSFACIQVHYEMATSSAVVGNVAFWKKMS